ncbi:MAG: NUDIX domain-containing protein [Candidatus Nanoarchaeia archaeon]|nr:NUDIX domain-containing protein [Candidatus Nanoarchaeia archaeon]MDD5239764.1 NUDIX domain-containing protein [Candidatus Nanoarchaeia archaeon]
MAGMTRDFVSTIFIVKDRKVLLIKHKKLGLWLPVGGHIEPNETPEEAAVREAKEESGLDIKLEPETFHKLKILKPHHVEIHPISKEHEHITFVYFTKPMGGKLIKNERECDDIRWFSKEELDSDEITVEIKHFAKQAIEEVK